MCLIDKVFGEDGRLSDVHNVVRQMTDPVEIARFYDRYVQFMRDYGTTAESRANPESVVRSNIMCALHRYNDEELTERWEAVILDPEKPISWHGKLY